MKNKKLVIALVALVLMLLAMLGIFRAFQPETVAGQKQITVTVVHKDGSSKDFVYQTDAEYLGELLLAEGLAEGDAGDYGLMISAVDGETADWNVDQSYWALFIGEEYATTGADGVVLTDGGVYKLVYTLG